MARAAIGSAIPSLARPLASVSSPGPGGGCRRHWSALRSARRTHVEALFTSLGVVAVAEIGDRTQLLALLLATQFRRPIPVICGILVATVANHAMAALAGEWVGHLLSPAILKWVLGLSFAGMAVGRTSPISSTALKRSHRGAAPSSPLSSPSFSARWATRRKSQLPLSPLVSTCCCR